MEDAHHLINAIRKYFKCSIDWEGKNYLGLTVDYNFTKKYRIAKIPKKQPACPQDAPHPWNKPVYGKHIQLATQTVSATKINSADTNRVQSITETF